MFGGRRAAATPKYQCGDPGLGCWPRGHVEKGAVPDTTGTTASGVSKKAGRQGCRREVSAQEGDVRPSATSEPANSPPQHLFCTRQHRAHQHSPWNKVDCLSSETGRCAGRWFGRRRPCRITVINVGDMFPTFMLFQHSEPAKVYLVVEVAGVSNERSVLQLLQPRCE